MTKGQPREGSARCEVCWLDGPQSPCSARCRGLRAAKRTLCADVRGLEDEISRAVSSLRPGTTLCPGVLAEQLARGRGVELTASDALACLRETYFALRAAKRLRFYQKGVVVPLGKDTLRGPFRLGR